MNLERILERLRDYRLRNEHFDRLVGAVMANKLTGGAVRASVSAAASVLRPRRRALSRLGQYEGVFFYRW